MIRKHTWWLRGLVLAMLLVFWALLLSAATRLSATIDEPFHITSGYEYLRTGKLRLLDEHTPLAKALFAWPLFFVDDLQPPENAAGYREGDLISVAQATLLAYRPLDRVIVGPRVAASLLTVILAATVFRFAGQSGGPAAGLLALAITTFDPNILAHGSLATTDMGMTAFSLWALWAGTRWLQRPTAVRFWVAAGLLGLAQGVKLTALLLYPVLGFGVLLQGLGRHQAQGRSRLIAAFGSMVGVSLLVLWALYGFEVRPVGDLLGGIPLPAASHIERWLRLQENLVYGREAFLLGQNSMHGWWYYFPVAFLVKTPLPMLLFGLLCIIWAICSAGRRLRAHRAHFFESDRSSTTFYLFPAVYALASLTSSLNIGYRHLLPLLPFVTIAISREIVQMPCHGPGWTRNASRLTTLLLLTWLAVGTLKIAPHYLTFFNELAGGPENGWRYLADSNTDWGQAYKALAEFQRLHNLEEVRLSTFTFYDPAAYGVDFSPITPMTGAPPVLPQRFNPEAGMYAISATTLDGVPLAFPPTFDWFRHQEPKAIIANAILLYDIQPTPGTWVAQCNIPVVPLSEETIDEGFGISGLRHITFDCEESWVFPDHGKTSGWYTRAIPEHTTVRWSSTTPQPDLLPSWLSTLTWNAPVVSYVQNRNGQLPAFAIWECDTCGLAQTYQSRRLENLLLFQGVLAPANVKPGATFNVITVWEIIGTPDAPLSLMLHIRSADNIPLAIGDGLGFPIDQWQVGDALAQRHEISLPSDIALGDYWIHVGAYLLEDLRILNSDVRIEPTKITVTP